MCRIFKSSSIQFVNVYKSFAGDIRWLHGRSLSHLWYNVFIVLQYRAKMSNNKGRTENFPSTLIMSVT